MTVARLGLDIDSAPAAQAAREIGRIIPAAQNAERAVDSMASGAAKGLQAVAGAATRATAGADGLAGAASRAAGVMAKASAVATSLQARIDAAFDTDSMRNRAADIAAYGAELDNIRAKYNPLFAASKQYEAALEDIARAERLGAISAMEAASARERAAQSITPTGGAGASDRGREAAEATAAFQRLRATLDETYRAELEVAQAQKVVDAALKSQTITAKEAADVMSRLKGSYGAAEAARYDAALAAQTASFQRLKASIDPVYRAELSLAEAQRTVNAAVKAGIATTEEAAAVMQRYAAAQQMAEAGSGRAASQIQNFAFQIGDFATQVGAGGSASVALAQQLPQLLGGFGALGAVMGAVVAVGVPLTAYFMSGGDGAKTFAEEVEGLSDALSRARDTADLVKTSQEGLTQVFAGTAAQVSALTAALQARDVGGIVSGIADTGRAAFATLSDEIKEIRTDFAAIGLDYSAADGIKQLSLELGIGTEQTSQLLDAMERFNEASSSSERNQAMLETLTMLQRWGLDTESLPPPMRDFANAILDASSEISQAVAEMRDLTSHTYGAVESGLALAASMRATAAATAAAHSEFQRLMAAEEAQSKARLADRTSGLAGTEDSRLSSDRGVGLSYQDRAGLDRDDPRNPGYRDYLRTQTAKSGRSAGGKSEADKEADRLKREAEARQRVVDGLQFEISQVGKSDVARRVANETRRAGVDLYSEEGQRIADLVERLQVLQDEQKRVEEINNFAAQSFADLFTAGISGANSFKDALGGLIAKLGEMAIQQGFINLMSATGFGSNSTVQSVGGFFGVGSQTPSFDGGGYTGNGARAGGLDGKGGYLAMMHPRETVIDHTRGGGAQAAQSTHVTVGVSVDNNGNLQAYVKDQITRDRPATVRQAVGTVRAGNRASKSFLG